VNVEDPDSIYQAIAWYENKFDFADALHLASSRRCVSFATFDSSFIKKAQQFSSMDMINP
jgi:predicted nucleic-acid-binding protein